MTQTAQIIQHPASKAPVFNKPFAWSYSRLKNYETCARRFLNIDLLKAFQEEPSEALTYGNDLHKALAERLQKKTPLPLGMTHLEEWAARVEAAAVGGALYVEQALAIRRDFGPCGYFDRPVWYRAKVDVMVVKGPVAVALDWKTGRILDDSVQLALTAACIFAHQPQVQAVRTEFVWLKEGETTRADFRRADMATFWNSILPRVKPMEAAHETGNESAYPPKRSGLCRLYCPVATCEHKGA